MKDNEIISDNTLDKYSIFLQSSLEQLLTIIKTIPDIKSLQVSINDAGLPIVTLIFIQRDMQVRKTEVFSLNESTAENVMEFITLHVEWSQEIE